MGLKKFLIICSASAFLFGCAPKPMDELEYYNWRRSMGQPEMSQMVYGGNTLITKEKKVEQIDPSVVHIAKTQGDYMEVMTRQFRQDLLSTGAQVKQDGNKVYVYMPTQAIFGSNQLTVKPSIEPALKAISKNLKNHSETMIRIIGHTDNSLGVVRSKELSMRQATVFANYLRSSGIASERLFVEGYGSRDPIANNNTPEGRAKNCYIEMIIYNLQ